MNARHEPAAGPIELVFGGRRPDRRTVELCVEAARSLAPHSRRIESCGVHVSEEGGETRIRIDVRTAEGEVLVDRLLSAPGEEALRATLRAGFEQVARGMDEAHDDRLHPFQPDARPPGESPPPCTYLG